VYNTTAHATTAYTPFELVYGFKSEIPSALREAPSAQYNYDSYLAALRGRLHSAHEVFRQKLITNKKSNVYYDKDTEEREIQVEHSMLLFDETVRRGGLRS
jgi:hypothetical protein